MQIKDLILKKRDGGTLSESELQQIVEGYVRGEAEDYQLAAWLMAVYFQGMTAEETQALTNLMWRSGKTLPREGRKDYWIDKHSTGGVGDKVSLILVPWVVATCRRVLGKARVRIPMISGRGLGHTGGTLDKLESVPGFNCGIDTAAALDLLNINDFFVMGQTDDLAPADRKIYALRDATATVDCLPLIVSSIMSKKLSENLDGLVFDVKWGAGSFMQTQDEAKQLAEALTSVTKLQQIDSVALITDMNEPLGFAVGNRVEVEECADFLNGSRRESGLLAVTLELATWMVYFASGRKLGLEEAKGECLRELDSAHPFELFTTMFEQQGGDWSAFEKRKPKTNNGLRSYSFKASAEGYVQELNPIKVAYLVGSLGGSRVKTTSSIDYEVGVVFEKKVGDRVSIGDPILQVYYRQEQEYAAVKKAASELVVLGPNFLKRGPIVWEAIQ